jgi:hypothetical protein
MPQILSPPDPETVRCPTCRASQPWSDVCRRCQSDLTLLHQAARSYHRHRRACLLHLRSGRPQAALLSAQRCLALYNGADSRRLGALCALFQEDWPTASRLALRLGLSCPNEDGNHSDLPK